MARQPASLNGIVAAHEDEILREWQRVLSWAVPSGD